MNWRISAPSTPRRAPAGQATTRCSAVSVTSRRPAQNRAAAAGAGPHRPRRFSGRAGLGAIAHRSNPVSYVQRSYAQERTGRVATANAVALQLN